MSKTQENLLRLFEKLESCDKTFGPVVDVMAIVSSVVGFLAFLIIVVVTPSKKLQFPSILRPLICLGSSITSFGYSFRGSYMKDSPFTCYFSAFLIQLGIVSTFYIWICSTVILYRVVVLKKSLLEIRSNKALYIKALGFSIPIMVLAPVAASGYGYVEPWSRCFLTLSPEWVFFFAYCNNAIGSVIFVVLAPGIIKTLLGASAASERLPRAQRVLLRDEALRQIILGIVLSVAAALLFYGGIQEILFVRWSNALNSSIIQAGLYSLCGTVYMCFSCIGTFVGLLFLLSRKTITHAVDYYREFSARAAVRRFCCLCGMNGQGRFDRPPPIAFVALNSPRTARQNALNCPSAACDDAVSLPGSVAPAYVDQVYTDQLLKFTKQELSATTRTNPSRIASPSTSEHN